MTDHPETDHPVTDRRLLRSNGRVAHVSLEGQVAAERFVDGTARQVGAGVAEILGSPQGPRERELVTGDGFRVLDRQGAFSFGFAERDGYVGWVASHLLDPARTLTHRVDAARSFFKATPDIKVWEPVTPLSYGARLEVIADDGTWARIVTRGGEAVVPSRHLAPLDTVARDPVAEAVKFLGTPYLWGGNSSFGIDCSGLVQAAWRACGVALPGDSDQQARAGVAVDEPRPGDLVFWRGHVAMMADETRLIHANAHHVAVAFESFDAACARIAADAGPVSAIRRVSPPRG